MTGRDRIVLIGSGRRWRCSPRVWMLVVSPERKKADQAQRQVATAQRAARERRRRARRARAPRRRSTPTAYASIVSLGKAVPPSQEVPSLIYQLAQASNQQATSTSPRSPPARQLGCARVLALTAAAAASAGFTQMPFTFVFNGSFFDLEHLFQQLNGFTTRTAVGRRCRSAGAC